MSSSDAMLFTDVNAECQQKQHNLVSKGLPNYKVRIMVGNLECRQDCFGRYVDV